MKNNQIPKPRKILLIEKKIIWYVDENDDIRKFVIDDNFLKGFNKNVRNILEKGLSDTKIVADLFVINEDTDDEIVFVNDTIFKYTKKATFDELITLTKKLKEKQKFKVSDLAKKIASLF